MSFYIPSNNEVKEIIQIFEEIEFKAKGGFKAVYIAKINSTKEALKLAFIPSLNDDEETGEKIINEEYIKRIVREVSILEKCSCKYIVKLGILKPTSITIKENNYVAYSEEFIEGTTLAQLIRDKYKPDEKELRILAICLLECVYSIWNDIKIIHRDIKPLNIIKTAHTDRPFVLLDFGIAYVLNETQITIDASKRWPPGTFSNLAPEMFQPKFRDSIDYRSDLYNIGLTLYEYATGTQPFFKAFTTEIATAYDIVNKPPQPIEELRGDLSSDISVIINQLLKKIPAVRPGNIKQLINLLEKTL